MSVLEELARGKFVKEGIATLNRSSSDSPGETIFSNPKFGKSEIIGNTKFKAISMVQMSKLRKLKNDLKKELAEDSPDFDTSKFDDEFESGMQSYHKEKAKKSFSVSVQMNMPSSIMCVLSDNGYEGNLDSQLPKDFDFGKQEQAYGVKESPNVISYVLIYANKPIMERQSGGEKTRVTMKFMCFLT